MEADSLWLLYYNIDPDPAQPIFQAVFPGQTPRNRFSGLPNPLNIGYNRTMNVGPDSIDRP